MAKTPKKTRSIDKDKTYWASAEMPPLECAEELKRRIDEYYEWLVGSGPLNLWLASYRFYNAGIYSQGVSGGVFGSTGGSFDGGFGGTDGAEIMSVNHYANILDHILELTVSQRPAFEPRSTNTDYKSQAQTILAKHLLDYYMREKSLEVYTKQAVKMALMFGEAYVLCEWDAEMGEVYGKDPESGAVIRQGDLRYSTFGPYSIVRDLYAGSADQCQWYVVQRLRNKWDLAAKYPEISDDILEYATSEDADEMAAFSFAPDGLSKSDLVVTYTLYHERTPACPAGRMLEMLDESIILVDGPLPYSTMPLKRVRYDEVIGTTFGKSVMFDELGIQNTINGLYSVVKTNQVTFGVQNIAIAKGSGFSVNEMAGGLNLIEFDASLGAHAVPAPLQLTKTAPETFNFIKQLENTMNTISGINSVIRGDPEQALGAGASGAYAALIQSMAIQFNNGLQMSYVRLLEAIGQSTINTLREYASVPRVAAIVGKVDRAYMQEFTGDDLSTVNRVIVDIGSPTLRTTAGKEQLAEQLIKMGVVKELPQLLEVINTGNLEVLTEGETAQLLMIKSENERLQAGEKVTAFLSDDHQMHLRQHASVMSNPDMRNPTPENASAIEEWVAHMQMHIQLATNPDNAQYFALLGREPVPVINPQPQVPGTGALPPQGPDAVQMGNANLPDLPQQPVNPLTKQRYTPPEGAQ